MSTVKPTGWVNGPQATRLAMWIGRTIPPALALPLIRVVVAVVSRRSQMPMVQSSLLNQWVATGLQLDSSGLQRQVRRTLWNTARNLYEVYHWMDRPDLIARRVIYTEQFEAVARQLQGRGAFFVSGHLGNFDLSLRALVQRGLRFQVLSFPEPPGGYRLQNELRRKAGMEITPMSIAALRQAGDRLADGGWVLTGIDRATEETRRYPRFFGFPSHLPVTHVRLALKARVPVVVLRNFRLPDGRQCVDACPPVELERGGDLNQELVHNAERILHILEGYIRQAPEQWSMFYPVWEREVITPACPC